MNKLIFSITVVFAILFILGNCSPKVKKAIVTENKTTQNEVVPPPPPSPENTPGKFNEMNSDKQTEIINKHFNEVDVTRGKLLYNAQCGQCHKLYEPEFRTYTEWSKIMVNMGAKANLKNEEYMKICAYLYKNCKK